jgi:DNA-directed RNA polymerase subunit M/transcription elongation factor TFIIS
MGSKLKTISLDGETSRIADEIPNFSQWVRAQLIKYDEHNKPKIKFKNKTFLCSKCEEDLISYHDLEYVHHDSKRLGTFRNTDCKGYFQEVLE